MKLKTGHLLLAVLLLTATFAVSNVSAGGVGVPSVPPVPDICKLVSPTASAETAGQSCIPTPEPPCTNCPLPPIVPCPPGEIGVEPTCFPVPVPPPSPVRVCPSSDGVGVVVTGHPVCVKASTSSCPSGYVGVTVNGIPVCVSPGGGPPGGIPSGVELCGAGTYGVKPYCTPIPQSCPSGSYGVRPDCHTAGTCTTGIGVRVDATFVCTPTFQMCPTSWGVQPYCCPSEEVGVRTGTSGGVCRTYPQGFEDACQLIFTNCLPPAPICVPNTNACVPPR